MKLRKYFNIIQRNSLFSSFTEDELENLFNRYSYKIVTYEKDTIVHLEGEECRTLDLVLEGHALVHRVTSNGDLRIITEFNEGDSIGLNLLFAKKNRYPFTIITKKKTTLIEMKYDTILGMCGENQEYLKVLLQCVSDNAVALTGRIKAVTLKSLRESIIEFLIYESNIQKSFNIKLSMSKKELAERFGVQRTSLSRELCKMREEGFIEYDSKIITIINKKILEFDFR